MLNPISIFVFPNALSILLLLGCNFLDKNLSHKTYIIFVFSMLIYCAGVFFGSSFRFKSKSVKFKNIKIDFLRFIIFFSLFVDLFTVLNFGVIESQYGIANALSNLSLFNAYIQNVGFNGFYNTMTFFSIPLSMIIQVAMTKYRFDYKKRTRVFFAVQFILCFVPFISTRRSMLVMALIDNVLVYLLLRKKDVTANYKKVLMFAGLVYVSLLFFSKTQQLMKKDLEFSITCYGVIVPKLLRDAFLYLAGNYSYLNRVINAGIPNSSIPFLSTFRVPLIYLNQIFELSIDTKTLFALPFSDIGVIIPYLFNTVPIHYYFFLDLGKAFIVEFFFMGLISGTIFKKATNQFSVWEILLCAIQFSIVLFSFREYGLIFLYNYLNMFFILIFRHLKIVTKKGAIV